MVYEGRGGVVYSSVFELGVVWSVAGGFEMCVVVLGAASYVKQSIERVVHGIGGVRQG